MRSPPVQALVYSLIALSSVAFGALAYFALIFTPANAIMAAVVFGCVGIVLTERILRQRAENRLEKAIQDLSRLLATDAQAGAVLGQRINALSDLNAGQRLETVESDISVLGTVIRQVAEAVGELEDKVVRGKPAEPPARPSPAAVAGPAPIPTTIRARPAQREVPPPAAPAPVRDPEPSVTLEALRQALADDRLVFHVQPVVRLPQRRTAGYDLVPRLMLENGELADPPDYMPRRGGHEAIRQIEAAAIAEAVLVARRARSSGQPVTLYIPLSRATLGDDAACDQLLAALDANRAIAPGLVFVVTEADWQGLTTADRAVVESITRKGAGFSIGAVQTLRLDIADLAALGVRSLRVDAGKFLEETESFTDFHASDISDYLSRFEVTLLATGISSERQIVELLDFDILLVQGNHIAAPGPIRADLGQESSRAAAPRRRAEG